MTSLYDAYSLLSENKEYYDEGPGGAWAPIASSAPPAQAQTQAQTQAPPPPPQPLKSTMLVKQEQAQPQPQPQPRLMILPAPQPAPAPPPPPAAAQQPIGPSYVDLLAGKRREILKVVGSALMILFALALYTGIEFWLKEVVVKHDWSFKQELGARLAYPFVVLLVLWNFKVLA